ncbi:LOW QUALITY PROTEIN: proto-oncogene tyrosine-protein kinase ROS [Hyperolius riggenbachi]|uniref:LOW QUALITY PROTEIN: proto-oncogene tyrosine-protein kinase ROS n=1 Tax=Hyperolius riggenbachi TaxID=752182 RepID=UPI0035A2F0CC
MYSIICMVVIFLSTYNVLPLQASAQIITCDSPCFAPSSDIQVYTGDCDITPTPPFVSYVGSHNITLGWKAANISQVTYMVQSKYVNIPGEWEYTQVVTETSYTVTNLQPYTEYWFRVIWIICQLHYYSSSSPAYRTLADGVPSTAPRIESLHSYLSDTIEVSWLPPLFPNGLIIGYNLKLYASNNDQQHISVTGRKDVQFYATKAATTYRFSITAVNEHGEGPAAEANVTTPVSADPDKSLLLFLSRNDTLKRRDNLKDLEEAQCLSVQSRINSVFADIYSQMIYFSESNRIWMKGALNMSNTSNLGIFFTGYDTITSIRVDWLYHKMFLLINSQIYMCDLRNCSAPANIPLQGNLNPQKIGVDPYNGYLFFLLDDGIHRMILPESPLHNNFTEHIVESTDILDFTINFQSKRLVFLKAAINPGTFYLVSVFLDGTNDQLLRKIADPSIKEIKSFLYFNHLLMLTDGNTVWYEEFLYDQYWFNEYIVTCDFAALPSVGFDNMILYGESTQPTPLPGQPELLMVMFGTHSAAILWKPPKLTVGASAAAWQKWTYSVSITSRHEIQVFSNISSTEMTLTGLNMSTRYEITVRASSPAGLSDWANPVVGTTLDSVKEDLYFIAAASTGVWKQSLDKFGSGSLLSDKLRFVSDLDWYNSTLYWSNETGHVHMWTISNTANVSPVYIPGIRRAGPLSFDWIGHFVYWADKVNAKIYRTSLQTFESEVVNVGMLLVTDMAVDSINAFLYWTTEYSVETSRLNGQGHRIIQNFTLFYSAQVVALALDFENGWLYWLVKNGLDINLYRLHVQQDSSRANDAGITEFTSWSYSEISQHALIFYSDRLFWINGQKYITVQEVNQSSCTPFSQPAQITAFTLVLNNQKTLPGNFSHPPEVIPDRVQSSSFEIKGNYSHFIIHWKAPSNIEYGTLLYCVESTVLQQMFGERKEFCNNSGKLLDSFYIVEGLDPYTEFDFTVTPYTYWGKGQTTSLSLRSPEGVPSEPLSPRAYRTQNSIMFDNKGFGVEMKWIDPKNKNGVVINYAVSYRLINESEYNRTVGTWITVNTTASAQSYILYNLSTEVLLQFQVQAYTSVGPGPFSEIAEVFISDTCWAPTLIGIFSSQIFLTDVDRKETLWNLTVEENITMAAYVAHDEELYYLHKDMMLSRNTKSQSEVLLLEDVRLLGSQSMTVDWIARQIYVTTYSEQNGTQLFFIDVERKKKNLESVANSYNFSGVVVEAVSIFPLLSRLYWLERWELGSGISYFDIMNDTVVHVLGKYNKEDLKRTSECDCQMNTWQRITFMALDTTNVNSPLIFFLCNETSIWASDMDGCHCWKLIDMPYMSERSVVTSLTVNDCFIYWSIKDNKETHLYEARKTDKQTRLLRSMEQHVQVLAYSSSLQSFPEKGCLVLGSLASKPVLLSTTNSSITLQLPRVNYELSCPFIRRSTTTYTVIYRTIHDAEYIGPAKNTSPGPDTSLEFQDQIALIPDLLPFTKYELEVNVSNYYTRLAAEKPESSTVTGETNYGVPEAAFITKVTVLSDSLINITWIEPSTPNGPLELIRYQIKVDSLAPSPSTPLRKKEFPDEMLLWTVTNLKSGTDHHIKVLAFHPDENWYSESTAVNATTFNSPSPPHNIVPGNTSIVMEWTAPEEPLANFSFEEFQIRWNWYETKDISCTNTSVYSCTVTGLVPNTNYVVYVTGAQSVSSTVNFKTTAGVPGKPGVPQNALGDKSTIQWQIAEDNGRNLTYNILEYRKVSSDEKELVPWQQVYNGSCSGICIWKSTMLDGSFQFRAAAANMLGLGDYSDSSEHIILQTENNPSDEVVIVVGSVLGVLLVLLLIAAVVIPEFKKKGKEKKDNIYILSEDKELTKLRGIPDAVGLTNACYAISTLPTKVEMENLPNFARENLNLCVFLGSGAFGEVYEGTATDILGPGTGTSKIAVKTLKSDATDNEKVEFLKEAHLMSQFHHPNILKLLGVCLFNEPQYIILELMDGGDLLSYLRGARPNANYENPMLSSMDLLQISLDISKGCAYLEGLHFVHRDLAARNCLVSVKGYNNPERTVKIGDFGLARDVYKSDYYRKRGEGLLPVRWMALESLIDGIFTTRSDVWSFGILLWEIFTLGQQPYQGYSNMEVIHYVRSGQRMDPPDNCPDDMWDLILKCWLQDPVLRPSFAHLQNKLKELRYCSLRCTQPKLNRMGLEGIVNAGFEDSNASVSCSDSEETGSMTLTEARNADGLNYLMVTT